MTDDDLDLSAWKTPAPPAGLVDGIVARVEGTGTTAVPARELPPPRRRGRAWIVAALGGAAIAAAVAMIALRDRDAALPRGEPGELVAIAPSTVTIAPGTIVTIDADASLRWTFDDRGTLHLTQWSGTTTIDHQPGRHLVVHAGTARIEADAARLHVEVPMASKSLRNGATGAALATVVIVAVYEGRAALSTPTGQVALDRGDVGVAPEADPPTVIAAVAPTPRRDVPTAPRRFASPAERSAALDELAKARARRELQDRVSGLNAAAGGSAIAGGLDPDDVRAAVKEILPLMAECFGAASPATVKLGGNLVAKLSLVTEPDVGTLIADADLSRGDAALIGDAGLTECLHETLLSLELPPLPDGGEATIDYPFLFAEEAPAVAPTQPAPKPAPKPTASAPKTVEQLITEANDASRAGKYGQALRAAEAALELAPDNQQALTVAAIAACNLKDARRVAQYLPQLSEARRGMIEQVCKRNGVDTDSLPDP